MRETNVSPRDQNGKFISIESNLLSFSMNNEDTYCIRGEGVGLIVSSLLYLLFQSFHKRIGNIMLRDVARLFTSAAPRFFRFPPSRLKRRFRLHLFPAVSTESMFQHECTSRLVAIIIHGRYPASASKVNKQERFECISGRDKTKKKKEKGKSGKKNRGGEERWCGYGDIYDENYDGIVLHDRWSLYRSRDENR